LKLQYDEPLSNFAFKFNLRCYLKDAGKLKLRTGRFIRCHYLSGGATGRVTVTLDDWDLDGVPAGAYTPSLFNST
jgi:hypothetical protein